MKKHSYTAIYEEDPEGGFVASVPGLAGGEGAGGWGGVAVL